MREWREFARELRALAVDLPDERRVILQGMYDTIRQAVWDQYTKYPAGAGRKLPPAFRGGWGANIRIWVQPQLGAVSIRNDSPYAGFVESGRPPGPVPLAVIEQWAGEKLGVNDKRSIRNIRRKIMMKGWEGMHLLERATSPYAADGVGPALHTEMGHYLRDRIDRLVRKYGWR